MVPPKTIPSARAQTTSRAAIRAANPGDAAAVWRLVSDSRVLDVNSKYAYLLAFRHHDETSVVTEVDGKLAGFVLAYRPPRQLDTLFVWQVGVGADHRHQGLARTMILFALSGVVDDGVRYLEATVTPSNRASDRLFRSIARDLHTACEVTPCFAVTLFADDAHEREDLYRVGPFPPSAIPAEHQEESSR